MIKLTPFETETLKILATKQEREIIYRNFLINKHRRVCYLTNRAIFKLIPPEISKRKTINDVAIAIAKLHKARIIYSMIPQQKRIIEIIEINAYPILYNYFK